MFTLNLFIKKILSVKNIIKKQNLTAEETQEKTLHKLLNKAKNTAFGKHYKFKGILKNTNLIQDFQTNIPCHDYNKMYEEWWHKQIEGQDNITWASPIKYYGLSSGTSGAPSKYIPESEEMLKSMRKAGYRMFFSMAKQHDISADLFTKDFLMIGGTTDLTSHLDGKFFSGDLSGINASLTPFWFKRYRPGKKIAKIKDWNTRLEMIARNAPKWDIVAAMGLPSWVQLVLERVIEYHKLDNIHQIWPNFQIFVSGGICLEPYKKTMDKLFAKPVHYADTYLASEGFIAFQTQSNTNDMELILNNGIFFEFVPFNEKNFDENDALRSDAKVLTISQVQENIDYALLLTTNAGAWRYLIGDTIRFTDVKKAKIIISGRTKHFLSICGEHLSVDNMTKGLYDTQEKMGITIAEFTVMAAEAGTHFKHKWYIGVNDKIDTALFAELLDAHLRIINDDYAAERNAMMLAPVVEIVPTNYFYEYLEINGKSMGQSKFPRVLKGAQVEDWENFIKQK